MTPNLTLPQGAQPRGGFDAEDGTREVVAKIGPSGLVYVSAYQFGDGTLAPGVVVMVDQSQAEDGFTPDQDRKLAETLTAAAFLADQWEVTR